MAVTSDVYNETSGIVGTLQDGRTIAKGSKSQIMTRSPFYIEVTIPNLKTIDAILDINLKTISPAATVYGICQKKVTRGTNNDVVVGFTVGMAVGLTAVGSTVTAEVVCIGW